jgi:hypothetical protein
MARKKKTEPEVITEPVVVKGSHLTVTHHPDGSVDTVWDWDKLAEDIDQAIKEYGNSKIRESDTNQTNTVTPLSDSRPKSAGRKKKETKNV